ncbi:MAG: CAP domain-containing protein [Mogibacterium sp.]|nr:CAP domain-containing protein [Mogibacterium sp.]
MAGNYGTMQAFAENGVRETDVTSASSGNVIVLVDGKFIYLSKAEILNTINKIRKEACEEGVRDPRNPSRKLTGSDYVPIKWSSDLEWIAQTRAAEATIHMAHDRPNGGKWSGVSHNGVSSNSEDIAWNYTADILGGIDQWYEEKTYWVENTPNEETGHYTSMINPQYRYVGIGAFKPAKGIGAVAGELRISGSLDESQNGAKGAFKQKVEIQKSKLTVNPAESCTVHIGKTVAVGLNARTSYENKLGSSWSPKEQEVLLPGVTYKSNDTSVATVSSDGTVIGKEPGTATINISYNGTTYSASVNVEDHDYKVVTVDPTCTEDGSETGTCNICGDKVTEVIPATGHKWNTNYTVDKKATCTAVGSKSKHCSVCNEVDNNTVTTIPKTAHKYGDWKVTKEATCTTDGSKEKVCTVCGCKSTGVISATGHKWKTEYTVDKKATCTAEGSESRHCSVCNAMDKTTVTVIPKTAHKYGDWKITKKAACTTAGSREKVCAGCSGKVTESIPATGHKWNSDYTTDKKATHSATGIESIHCSVCNSVKSGSERTTPVIEHTYGVWKTTKAATCTSAGSKKRVCSDADCGYVEEVRIPATGHKWESNYTVDKEPTCTAKGSESIHCSVCDAVKEGSAKTIKAKGHSFGKWTITKKPTVDAEGSRERVCSVCKAKETESIDKLSAQAVAAAAIVEADLSAKNAESAANKAADLQKAADEAAKTPGDAAIAAAKKAKDAAEAAKKAADEAKKAADKADAAADKAKADAKNAAERTAADAAKKKSTEQVSKANTAVSTADKAVKTADASVKAAEDAKASHIGTPEIKLSATEFTYKYAVKKVKVGKKKKKQAVAEEQKPASVTVSLNGKVISPDNYDVVWSNENSSAIGKYTVTVTLKGDYKGANIATYNINPKPAKISKPAKGKKKLTVKWKKASKNDIKYKALDGYEIQYSLSSDFSSEDTKTVAASKKAKSKAIKKLQSKQTYYVHIRTYKTAGGVKFYSSWSAVKSVTVK